MVSRASTAIGYKGAQSIYYASREVANYAGYPLNTLITINFALTAISPLKCVEAFARLRTNHFNKWATRPGAGVGAAFDPTYFYVFENAKENEIYLEVGEGLPHNIHTHWHAHIPASRRFDFENRVFEWLDYVAGSLSAAGAINIQDITDDNGVTPYCLKGAQKHVAKRFGAEGIYKPQGLIIGKRTGVSLNIGPKVRKEMDTENGVDRRWRLRRAA